MRHSAPLLPCALVAAACGGGGGGSADAPSTAGDAAADASPTADAATTCGGATCRADQACVADACTFACDGVNVPGDYATIAGAAAALSDQAGAVICLGAQAYTEDGLLVIGTDMSIIGVSAQATTIQSATSIGFRGTVTVKGVTFPGLVRFDGVGSATTAVGVAFGGGLLVHRQSLASVEAGATGTLDGCDVAGGITMMDAPGANSQWQGDLTLNLANSYLHGATEPCLRAFLTGSSADLFVTATNNTFVGCQRGVHIAVRPNGSATTTLALALHDNIIANTAEVAYTLDDSGVVSDSTVATGHNALWGNTTNFEGAAVPGPGDVGEDCLLDTAIPPAPGPGSPCLAAGDLASGSDHDYWGRPRPAVPDLGAVEREP
jgi:hypothetical protein